MWLGCGSPGAVAEGWGTKREDESCEQELGLVWLQGLGCQGEGPAEGDPSFRGAIVAQEMGGLVSMATAQDPRCPSQFRTVRAAMPHCPFTILCADLLIWVTWFLKIEGFPLPSGGPLPAGGSGGQDVQRHFGMGEASDQRKYSGDKTRNLLLCRPMSHSWPEVSGP